MNLRSFVLSTFLLVLTFSKRSLQVQGFVTQNRVPYFDHLKPTKSLQGPSRKSSVTTLGIWNNNNEKKAPQQDPLKSTISQKRREQLGIGENEREYDLGVALETNTDPLITKIIAGSFILVVIALLVAGIVVPSLTDYGEGVCNPILTGGRC